MNACTLFPDHIGSYDLSAACAAHDEDYDNQEGWLASNWLLYCRVKQLGLPGIALLMLIGTSSPVGLYFYLRAGCHG